jgi:hypothetical protein
MLWTVVQADLLYTLMTVPLLYGVQISIALYQRRKQRIAQALQEEKWAKTNERNKRRHAPLRIGRYRRRRYLFIASDHR